MYNKNLNGTVVTVDEDFPVIDIPEPQPDNLSQLAEGLASATTIAQIRAAAKAVLNVTESSD